MVNNLCSMLQSKIENLLKDDIGTLNSLSFLVFLEFGVLC